MQRHMRAIGVMAAAAMVVTPLSVRADVVEEYERETVYYDDQYACATVSDGDEWTDVCGMIHQHGAGADPFATIAVQRSACSTEGSFSTCTSEYGSAVVEDAAVIIDRTAGTATIDGMIDDCAIQMQLTATEGPREYAFGTYGMSPRVRTRDLAVVTHHGWEISYDFQPSDATGSACDWYSGEWDYAELGRVTDTDREAGYHLHPEEAPVVGGGITRGERPAGESSGEHACALWDVYTSDSDTYIDVCADNVDDDNDGSIDRTQLSAWRMVCDSASCQAEQYRASDVEALTLDLEAAWAQIAGTAGDCVVDVTLDGDAETRGSGTYDGGYDSIGPGSEGDVVLGYSTRDSYDGMWATPADGASVCGWTEIADADWSSGFIEESHHSSTEHHIGFDPEGIEL